MAESQPRIQTKKKRRSKIICLVQQWKNEQTNKNKKGMSGKRFLKKKDKNRKNISCPSNSMNEKERYERILRFSFYDREKTCDSENGLMVSL